MPEGLPPHPVDCSNRAVRPKPVLLLHHRTSALRARLVAGLLLLFSLAVFGADAPKPKTPKPAKIQVSGYGLLGNYDLKRTLATLELAGKKPEYLTPSFIEDAASILAAHLKQDGYLHPNLDVLFTLADGARLKVDAASFADHPLPRSLRVTRARFQVLKGVRYYFQSLQFSGLETISDSQARSCFIETGALFRPKSAAIYTPENLRRGLASLTDLLDRQGYHESTAEAGQVRLDDLTGAVTVRIDVRQGLKLVVRSVREQFIDAGEFQPKENLTVFPNKPYSRLWEQDFILSLKTNLYHQGYPDAKVELKPLDRHEVTNLVELDLLATVAPGPKVHIGSVEFLGARKTRPSLIHRSARVQRGELLDPVRVEQGRYRLARLGIFDSVDLSFPPVDDHTRDVVYELKEAKSLSVSLLLGWGSYELLRGGIDLEERNILGLGHRAELRAVQSFKSTSGGLTYTVPELVGDNTDLFLNGSGLRREEIDFVRLEYGGGIGLHDYLPRQATDASLRYNYQILSALDFNVAQEVASEGLTNPAVGSITLEIKHDRRDNPLYPRSGYKFFATIETATTYLGGDANYERVELSASWHHPLCSSLYLGLSLSQGVDVSFGSPANNLPFNKRFFPGGDNSIRGYQEGQASPRNSFGQIVGAETYSLVSVELEQALTPKWSVVLFSDSLGFAQSINDYPFDTGLFSIGAGVRWRTLIGPVRLEYGHNLNPRPGDPSGTVLFSLGYPF